MNELEDKYLKIWELAKPYYKKGRIYDIPHIEWMMGVANNIAEKESLDKEILLPLCILHDIGYSKVGLQNPNVKDKKSKIVHMKEGAELARTILATANFNPEKSNKVAQLVSVHDNWLLGDDEPFKKSKEMAVFNDLDFIWPFSNFKQFETNAASMGLTPEEADKFWEGDEKFTRRPFRCESTIELFNDYNDKIKREIHERARRN